MKYITYTSACQRIVKPSEAVVVSLFSCTSKLMPQGPVHIFVQLGLDVICIGPGILERKSGNKELLVHGIRHTLFYSQDT